MKVMIRTVALAALLFVALSAQVADAQYFGRNKIQYKNHDWHILSTPHFDIHYYAGGEAFAARAAIVLEDGYGMLAGKLREVVPWRIPVILYASHADFLQTNIDPSIIGEGVQAFAEPRRRRIVLPFTSSFKEFQHTAIHELAHTFTFHIVYNRMLDNVFTRSYLPGYPLWVMEGIAEYLSVGWDTDSDMYIRDAVIHDYLVPFYRVGGFYVYKEGQSVFNYIADTYGHEKVIEFLDALAASRSAGTALARTLGLSEQDLYAKWQKSLKKHYWPIYPNKVEVGDIGRRLTNHVQQRGYYNTKPILSPDGENIAYFSDQSGLIGLLVMSALDGEIVERLVTGSRSNRYESLHFLTSSMAWSPTGERVAFVAKSKGHDVLFIKDIFTGEEDRIEVPSDGLAAPAWSPVANEIILSATYMGQTDLVLVNLDDGTSTRLTEDPADQLTPRFFPDGKKIVFVYYPEVTIPVPGDFLGKNRDVLAEIDFLAGGNVLAGANYDVWEFDMSSRRQRSLVTSPGDDTEPIVLSDGKTLIYASDVSGINNLHTGNIESGEYYRFTDVVGGVFSPSVNEDKGRIAFSAFVHGGHDVYVSDDLPGMLARRYNDLEPGILAHSPYTATRDLEASESEKTIVALPGVDSGALSTDDPASVAASPTLPTQDDDIIDIDTYEPVIRPFSAPPQGEGAAPGAPGASRASPIEGITESVLGEDTQSRGASVSKYKMRLAPDFIGQGGGLYFSTGFGFGISNTIALSDVLGDHRMGFSFNLYRNIQESDFLLTYSYMKRRIDYSIGVFQFKSFLDSRMTSLGEGFSNYQLFSERNYGLFALMSLPFNKFYRAELNLTTYISDREFFETDVSSGLVRPTSESTRRLMEPSIAFVHDSSFYGPFGPVEGSRWRVTASRAVGLEDRDVSRFTGYVDYRWYKTLFYRNSFAFRMLGAASTGKDPRLFFLGGPTTLRGYDYLAFEGTKMGMFSVEYRFPLIDALVFGWPGRWGFNNIGGSVFFDAGSIWDEHDPNFFVDNVSGLQFQDIRANVGVGTYMYFGYFLLNFQFAWPTNARAIDRDYQFHFYMGPTF